MNFFEENPQVARTIIEKAQNRRACPRGREKGA